MPEAPDLTWKPKPVAVCLADIHLSHKPPTARSAETNWLAVQEGYLRQVAAIAGDLPVLITGDIFDRWNPPVELVNMALAALPTAYAIPGNHDLTNHNLDAITRTAYWTLVAAGKIYHVEHTAPRVVESSPTPLRLHAFPWGVFPQPLTDPHDLYLEIALIHLFVWTKRTGYPGAPEETRLKNLKHKLRGYDLSVTGDNHVPFEGDRVFNCGSLMRRRSDEQDYRPSIGIIYSDASVVRQYLDVSQDRFVTTATDPQKDNSLDFTELIQELSSDVDGVLSFEEALRQAIAGEDEEVRQIVLKALETGR